MIRNLSKQLSDEFGTGYSVANENWSVRVLERNIKSGYYKRMLSTQLPDKENKVLEFVKDPFVLEFMGVTHNLSQLESDMETAIINNL